MFSNRGAFISHFDNLGVRIHLWFVVTLMDSGFALFVQADSRVAGTPRDAVPTLGTRKCIPHVA